MRVVFLTLLLGLVAGPQTIELAVEGRPAAVEILFDDVLVARLGGPRWVADLDFGADPLPCEVVARAVDEEGRELARAVQRVNLPHERDSLDIALERNAQGAAVAARLVWQSAAAESATELSLTLDGRPLDLTGDRAPLPRLDAEVAHVLEARATSDAGTRGTALLMGGAYVDRVATELVGVPVRFQGGLGAAEVARCLAGPRGEPVEVQSLDESGAEIFLVASRESRYALRRKMIERPAKSRGAFGPASDLLKLRLPAGSRATFYWPELAAESRDLGGGRRTEIFRHSATMEVRAVGLWERISAIEPLETLPTTTPRLADAAGVAVLAAAGSGRPRAVVVVSALDEPDTSRLRPGQIRALARSLHVPIRVWSLSELSNPAWGPATSLHESSSGLRKAHHLLRDELEAQRIAWVRGATALHRISVRPDCAGIELAH